MTNTIRKDRVKVSPAQKLEYAKLMIEDNYSNQQDMELSGTSSSAVVRWEKQYLTEKNSDIYL